MAIFFKVKSLEEMHILLALVEKLPMQAFPKSLLNPTKNGIEKDFSTQWLIISPKSMISFKFYENVPLFNIFVTLYLGKGHFHTINEHSGPDGVCYGQFI